MKPEADHQTLLHRTLDQSDPVLLVGIRVGMPTTKKAFSLIMDTVSQLLDFILKDGLGCVWDLAGKLEWATSIAMQTLELQPITRGYAMRFGMGRLAWLVRQAELYALATLLKRYAERQESEDAHLDHVMGLKSHPEADGRVYH